MTDQVTGALVIVSERHFAVDAARLYHAFENPDLLRRWWGPHGFTNRFGRFELVEGGTWEVTMTSSSGKDFHNLWTFLAVEPGRTIVAHHAEPVHVFTLHMTYAQEDNGTRLSWKMHFEDTPENRELQPFLAAANQQNFDRLEEILDISGKGE